MKQLKIFLAVLLMTFTVGAFSPQAYASKRLLPETKKHLKDPILELTLGKAEIHEIDGRVADILVADPAVADVVAIQSDQLYIVGSQLGDTNIIALDEDGNVVARLNIHVRIDTDTIEAMVHELFPTEKDVRVRATTDQVYLTGEVANPSIAQKIARLVSAHVQEIQGEGGGPQAVDEVIGNLLEVRGEQQVMMRMRIMEVSRDIIKELGVGTNINANFDGDFGDAAVAAITAQGTGLTADPFGAGQILLDTSSSTLGILNTVVQALEQDSLINILAEPNLTAVSGEQAGFLAGGEFPVPVGRDREGNIIIEFREFGVSLNFVPIVMSRDRISLQLNTEVSSLDFAQGVTLAEVNVPGLDVRRASTTIEMGSGSSMMIAGLLKSDSVKAMSGLPGISKTPIIGELAKSRSFQREETELVIMVTPYLVKPYADRKQAKKVPVEHNTHLTKTFAANLRRVYGRDVRHIPSNRQKFGYILN